ncbi:hypothetical protein VTJ49DRAFT_244 [Mycothermus thermophilus]|uniref:RRM domain-containing protein n=1 Tax=Humicola insolens TaxID=85995 RepID=A0ABR3VFX0_HUMIN
MSYPGPPGVSKPSHPSLPPRPPVTNLPGGFKPAFKPAFSPAPGAASAPGYTPPAAASPTGYGPVVPPTPSSYGASPTVPPYAAANPAIGATRPGSYGPTVGPYAGYTPSPTTTTYAPQQPTATAPYFGTPRAVAAAAGAYSAPPQIRNPFPAAATADSADYDPEMAAQIAQWQSAYMPRDPNDPSAKPGTATGGRPGAGPAAGASGTEAADAAAAAAAAAEKKKTVYREGGGKKWQDDTLLEWDPSHLRLFVGNLAGETTDESLLKAFSRWKSVQKAKVIRDKRTSKSKGFGFVSFSDPEDFFQAAKEMNGKYIQSHPVVVRKAKTEIKPAVVKEERNKGKHGAGGGAGGGDRNKGKSGSGMGGSGVGAYEPRLGPTAGAGITKPGQKTKGGLKLLG